MRANPVAEVLSWRSLTSDLSSDHLSPRNISIYSESWGLTGFPSYYILSGAGIVDNSCIFKLKTSSVLNTTEFIIGRRMTASNSMLRCGRCRYTADSEHYPKAM